MKKRIYILFFVLWVPVCKSLAQDALFSQYYAAPMYLNPALTGSSNSPRVTLNYRNQWPGLSANFVSTSFAIEHYVDKYNTGIGLIVNTDNQYADLSTTTVGGLYSYNYEFTENFSARFGLSASYNSRSIGTDWSRFIFGDQIGDGGQIDSPISSDPIIGAIPRPRFNYLDLGTGAIFYNQNFWAGLGVKHLNRPGYSFVKDGAKEAKLPILYSFHGGYKFILPNSFIGQGLGDEIDREKSISPSFLYERRGQYQHFDLGVYFTYSPFIAGAWYRGMPIFKQDQSGATRNVAGIFMVGYRQDNLTFGYSYDANLLNKLNKSGGAHEISISYQMQFEKGQKGYRKKKVKPIPCPKL